MCPFTIISRIPRQNSRFHQTPPNTGFISYTDGHSPPSSRRSGDRSDARAGVCTQTLNRGQTPASTRVWKHAELRAHVSDEKRKADLWTAHFLLSFVSFEVEKRERRRASRQRSTNTARGSDLCSRWHAGSTPTSFSDSKHTFIFMLIWWETFWFLYHFLESNPSMSRTF